MPALLFFSLFFSLFVFPIYYWSFCLYYMYYGPSRQRVADFCVLSNKAKTEDTKKTIIIPPMYASNMEKRYRDYDYYCFSYHMSYEKAIVESFYYYNKIFHGLSYGKKV